MDSRRKAIILLAIGHTSLRVNMRELNRHNLPEDDEPTSEDAIPHLTPLKTPLRIEQLGWSRSDAAEVRARLQSFANDWDDPDMDVYDARSRLLFSL